MERTLLLYFVGIFMCLQELIPAQLNARSSDPKKTYGGSQSKTEVKFKTSDISLQKVFDEAEKKAKLNLKEFGKYQVLVEGGGYRYVWLETQPMGGYMYAKRNLAVARNNIQIFMDLQREDGRFPGMITFNDGVCFAGIEYNKDSTLNAVYGWFQGYFFPMPAFELYYWLNKDNKYLSQLYIALEKFDNYLWRTHDSDNDGCLESWCVYDTGEDNSLRYGKSPVPGLMNIHRQYNI